MGPSALDEGVEASEKEGPKFMQRLVAKQKTKVKNSLWGLPSTRFSLFGFLKVCNFEQPRHYESP